MATLADLVVGDQVLFACTVTSLDPTNGMGLNLYGPSATLAAVANISTAGAFTGQLAAAPNQIPVNVVTGFAPVALGDVLQDDSGSTYVCRWTEIGADGTVLWSYRPDGQVQLPAQGFTTIGHVALG